MKLLPLTLLLLLLCLIGGCSSLSQSSLARNIALSHHIEIERQRQAVLPGVSHIGLRLLLSSGAESGLNEALIEILVPLLAERTTRVFNEAFASASLIDSSVEDHGSLSRKSMSTQQRFPRQMDFVLDIHLLAVAGISEALMDTQRNHTRAQRLPPVRLQKRPYRALVKINLMDARTRQLLDTATIRARSGALVHNTYGDFWTSVLAAYVTEVNNAPMLSARSAATP